MRTVSAMDIRKRLGEILDAASAGERILIERDHQPLAYLVSVRDGERLSATSDEVRRRRLAALDRLEVFAEDMRRQHPPEADDLHASALVRLERDRDEPGRGDG